MAAGELVLSDGAGAQACKESDDASAKDETRDERGIGQRTSKSSGTAEAMVARRTDGRRAQAARGGGWELASAAITTGTMRAVALTSGR